MVNENHKQQSHRVNLSELLEVRNAGLTTSEVLTILAFSCECLIQESNKCGLFSTEQVFLTRDGQIEIQLIPIRETPNQTTPPELLGQSRLTTPIGTSDKHLIWCLGKCFLQTAIQDHSDISLFSLLNLMTVDHAQSRPSLQKVRQMIRNRLDIDLDRMPNIISNMYEEVMGDLNTLLHDPFDDDIRFSSTRSSQLSIIPGQGSLEYQRERRNLDFYQQELLKNVTDRLRRDFSLSKKQTQLQQHETKADEEELTTNLSNDEALCIPDNIHTQIQKPQMPSKQGIFLPTNKFDENVEEGELTPRGASPADKFASNPCGTNNNEELDVKEEFIPIKTKEMFLTNIPSEMERRINGSKTNSNGKEQISEYEQNKCDVSDKDNREMHVEDMPEIHDEVAPVADMFKSNEDSAQAQHQSLTNVPKSARLYAKAAQTAEASKAARIGAKKPAQIEVLNSGAEQIKESLEKCDPSDDIEDSPAISVTGHSPTRARRKQILHNRPPEQCQQQSNTLQEKEKVLPTQQFSRQNSLQPGRCSKRINSGMRKIVSTNNTVTTTLIAVPEFLRNNAQANIRLRAQSIQKKKIVTLHRVDSAVVFVRLLNGNTAEVNCKTDHLVGSIFHTVAEHLDITEHLFFGLVLQQRQGEHVFLDEDQKLEKWAPLGWKNGAGELRRSFGAGSGNEIREQFLLHLCFRYYPKKREFVKTAITAHQLYLQLRQDTLSGALRFLLVERALEMAALALCVEYGQPPTGLTEYFKLENYLPAKFYDIEPTKILQTQKQIVELHLQFVQNNMGKLEAEERFIALCQTELYYGAHFYHVHKLKPKHGQQPFPSNTRQVAIMPSGIGICREERDGTKRSYTSLHEWSQIRTLQFDRKRFLLGTVENGIAVDYVFYTDHHTKSAYLVRFAASQHRFMLKMRQWQGTLNRMRAMQRHKDVGIDQHQNLFDNEVQNEKQFQQQQTEMVNRIEQEVTSTNHHRNTSQPQMGTGVANYNNNNKQQREDNGINITKINDETWKRQSRLLNDTDKEYIQYCYGPDAQRIEVILEKHPEFGLGLTLVDGAVNGVKGVYVKSVSAEGDGRRKGLLIGDCIMAIGGVSLFNRTRHDAVELVRDCSSEVRLEILRFPSISEVLAQDLPVKNVFNNIGDKILDSPNQIDCKETTDDGSSACKYDHNSQPGVTKNGVEQEKRKESTITNQSRASESSVGTPQLPAISSSNASQQRRQRAVSDFGTFGGNLPVLRTDDLLAAVTPKKQKEPVQRYRRHKTSAGFSELRTSNSDEESTTDSESELPRASPSSKIRSDKTSENIKNENYQISRKGEYLPPVSAMYGALENDELSDDDSNDNAITKRPHDNKHRISQCAPENTHVLHNSNDGIEHHSSFTASIERYVQQGNNNNTINFTFQPNKNIDAGKYSGLQQTNLDWTNDISDLESTTVSPLSDSVLKSIEPSDDDEEIISVTLFKTGKDALGLSLAKRMGYEGIFVRNIAPGSLAAKNGILRNGDRIWRIQNEELPSNASPASVVNKLKENDDVELRIQVKRKIQRIPI